MKYIGVFGVLLVIFSLLPWVGVNGMNPPDAIQKSQLSKEEIADSLNYASAVQALNQKRFVIEIDRINFSGQPTIFCQSLINFISLDGNESTVQISLSNHRPLQNGVGGFTLQGKCLEWNCKTLKSGTTVISYQIQGVGISGRISITMAKDDSYVTARFTPTFRSGMVTVYGNLVPFESSNIFKGQPL